MDHWGVIEKWSYPEDGYGDCEDYALLKRRMLMRGRLAARGAADDGGARQERQRPRGPHGQDRPAASSSSITRRRRSCSGRTPATASSSASRSPIRIAGSRSAIRARPSTPHPRGNGQPPRHRGERKGIQSSRPRSRPHPLPVPRPGSRGQLSPTAGRNPFADFPCAFSGDCRCVAACRDSTDRNPSSR